jgi:hypothetical protein
MKKIAFAIFLIFLVCAPNKSMPDIQATISSIGPAIMFQRDTLSTPTSDTVRIDSLEHVNNSLRTFYYSGFDTAFLEYQRKDSVDVCFYVQIGEAAENFNFSASLSDSATIKMDLS